MELFEVLDKDGNTTGYQKGRNEELEKTEFALVTHLWIKNSKGEYLTQQRSIHKKVDPKLWSITSGFVSSLETTRTTIARELEEELGIKVDLDELIFMKRMFPNETARHTHIADIFMLNKDINLEDVVLQEEEVMDVAYRTEEEIKSMMKEHKLMDFRQYYDNYYDDIFGVE